jgi:hypothetical protein
MLWTACIAQENEPEGLFSEEYGLYTQESSHTVRSHDSWGVMSSHNESRLVLHESSVRKRE